MDLKLQTLVLSSTSLSIHNHKKNVLFFSPSIRFSHSSSSSALNNSRVCFTPRTNRITKTSCISPVDQDLNSITHEDESQQISDLIQAVELVEEEQKRGVEKIVTSEFSGNESIFKQIQEIALFAGPAVGLWICGPLMSLIDTAVIGQGSSLELAALGPGTVVCDYASYVFMFLSIATSNMVATSLAREGKKEVQHKISMLLFVGFTCGLGMLLLTKVAGAQLLTAFAGPKNLNVVPAANTYVQIRGLAWPAILVGWVAQSASLGMKDSWGPLKALAVASAVNAIGDIVLCCFLGYGIAGAAWATMVSQVVAAFMMIESLNKKGFNAFSVSIPSPKELLKIFELAAPVFITMISKVAFYSLLTYSATSMGTLTMAAHQVMIQVYCMCTVWGEPLSQTAQSFMPELIFGIDRSLKKARRLLKSLLIIGAITGSVLGIIGTAVPWFFPYLFTADSEVVGEMHKVLLAYWTALVVTPATHSLEGTLLSIMYNAL
ncbi:Detoxification 46 protein [Thalictrum thalictroides]|uniref:Protein DETOXIFICATION n=1 Tax=Thalictrum thalictroides TaxID=46969 RepID=A0A7J6WZ57_THATH|nr:Detoxification 46 protein [Thalictrum thalictroides]